jgi:acetyl-CoA C-acetyltransferase
LQDTDAGAEIIHMAECGFCASGLRQLHEIVRQLRGEAGDRQVPGDPKVGFTQLYGAPGSAAATILTT